MLRDIKNATEDGHVNDSTSCNRDFHAETVNNIMTGNRYLLRRIYLITFCGKMASKPLVEYKKVESMTELLWR